MAIALRYACNTLNASSAMLMTDTGRKEDRWWALIGPQPHRLLGSIDPAPHDKTRRLVGSYALGRYTVEPGPGRLDECVASDPTSPLGHGLFQSWPIQVSGVGSSSRFDRDVWRALRRLAVLFAVAWYEPWHVRHGPTPYGNLAPQLPDTCECFPRASEGIDLTPSNVALPDLVSHGWTVTERDRELAKALVMWHEGLLLLSEHPTIAMIAAVASIEGASRSAAICALAASRGCVPPDPESRPGQRFRDAAALVRAPDDDDLFDGPLSLYEMRNATVHEAFAHGLEHEYGAFHDFAQGWPPVDDAEAFALTTAPRALQLAHRLLHLTLTSAIVDDSERPHHERQ